MGMGRCNVPVLHRSWPSFWESTWGSVEHLEVSVKRHVFDAALALTEVLGKTTCRLKQRPLLLLLLQAALPLCAMEVRGRDALR